jgi:hypothetical protein
MGSRACPVQIYHKMEDRKQKGEFKLMMKNLLWQPIKGLDPLTTEREQLPWMRTLEPLDDSVPSSPDSDPLFWKVVRGV